MCDKELHKITVVLRVNAGRQVPIFSYFSYFSRHTPIFPIF